MEHNSFANGSAGLARVFDVKGLTGFLDSGRSAPLEKTNTGVLRFAQNDNVKQTTATADPLGDDKQEGQQQQQ